MLYVNPFHGCLIHGCLIHGCLIHDITHWLWSRIARSIPEVGGAGRSERSFSIELHRLGPETWPLYGVEGWPHIRGFVSTVLYGDAFGT